VEFSSLGSTFLMLHTNLLLLSQLVTLILADQSFPQSGNYLLCGTKSTSSDVYEAQRDFETRLAKTKGSKRVHRRSSREKTIPVYFHIIEKGNSIAGGLVTSVISLSKTKTETPKIYI
jgi:hypothetical protein